MNVFPLKSITLDKAKKKQFQLVDETTKVFNGEDILNLGDLGVKQPNNTPKMTLEIEKIFANFFGAEMAMLVRGSGTGAIRNALVGMVKSGDKILIHDAPIYPTTKTTLESFGAILVKADFNKLNQVKEVIAKNPNIKVCLLQITRQKLEDNYDYKKVIKVINKNIPVITDDNYAVMKVDKIGVEVGACISTFSTFKTLGPEGIGMIVGEKKIITKIRKANYSGGSQVQGYEAQAVLRGLIYAPVSFAIQSEENEKIFKKLNNNFNQHIKSAQLVNAQSKVLIVKFKKPIAKEVLKQAVKLGAAPHPVGAESKYEFVPMFYKVSGTFLKYDASAIDYMIRINPMRSGEKTILRILEKSIENVFK
ncbi:MAG: aminotransferase class V-fold PLP-dependent enzyme [Spiroplasma sp.]|nr:aminotransferase class V-fold PLP-dependent enzyme [Mycoplasmatales bacterium]